MFSVSLLYDAVYHHVSDDHDFLDCYYQRAVVAEPRPALQYDQLQHDLDGFARGLSGGPTRAGLSLETYGLRGKLMKVGNSRGSKYQTEGPPMQLLQMNIGGSYKFGILDILAVMCRRCRLVGAFLEDLEPVPELCSAPSFQVRYVPSWKFPEAPRVG